MPPELVRSGSPEWHRKRLLEALDIQAKRVGLWEKYIDGDHPLPTPPQGMSAASFAEAKQAFLNLSRLGVTNMCPLIASAPAERLQVTGFRFGDSLNGDADAWRMWQRNHLDADSRLLHDTVFQVGNAYTLVWPNARREAVITMEHPSEMIVAYAAGSRRERVAALKRWVAEDGRWYVTLYTPEYLYKWKTRSRRPLYGTAMGDLAWEQRRVEDEEWPLPNPLRRVPVVEFAVNTGLKARPFGGGVPEFARVLPIQNRMNKTVFDRLVTGEYQAFRQRWAIGWKPPLDPETGEPDPAAMFRAGQSRFMTFGGKRTEVEVGEFDQADFTPFLKSLEADMTLAAAFTKTPPYYLLGRMENISADGIAATDAGLVSKTEGHRDVLSESHEETISLGLRAQGDTRADDPQTSVLWRSIEIRTLAQIVDAGVKMQTLGVPEEEIWSLLPGVDQQRIERWLRRRKAQQLESAAEAEVEPVEPEEPEE